jgi:hypothetical protein
LPRAKCGTPVNSAEIAADDTYAEKTALFAARKMRHSRQFR